MNSSCSPRDTDGRIRYLGDMAVLVGWHWGEGEGE